MPRLLCLLCCARSREQIAAFFLAFKGVENLAKADGPLTVTDLFTNSIFRNIVISILATLGLYILASLIFVGFSSSRDQNLSRSSCA